MVSELPDNANGLELCNYTLELIHEMWGDAQPLGETIIPIKKALSNSRKTYISKLTSQLDTMEV